EEEDDDEELDEADAAHAAAEEVLAAEQAKASEPPPGGEPAAEAAQQQAATPPPDAGARGLPADKRPAAREGRRGRRRGGRGRRRGGESARPEQPKGERRQENGKPWQSQERRGGNGDKRNGNGKHRAQIQDQLKEGDEVRVQVVKDPIGTKGARITCHISLPGRHLVFMPTVDHVGISRRIENEKERRRLRELVDRYRPPGTGFIVRTVAENEPSEKLTADIKFLLATWTEAAKTRKVWLKSGGYIIIDQTEALVAIDVNSGRYVGKKGAGASLEDTITKINCEAAKEIVYQLRLRNIGGIIIIDFIDMDKGANR